MPLQPASQQQAYDSISQWPEYQAAPLRSEPDLAIALGIESVWLKDETQRLGVGSFKALGGAYAVSKLEANSGPTEFAKQLYLNNVNTTQVNPKEASCS